MIFGCAPRDMAMAEPHLLFLSHSSRNARRTGLIRRNRATSALYSELRSRLVSVLASVPLALMNGGGRAKVREDDAVAMRSSKGWNGTAESFYSRLVFRTIILGNTHRWQERQRYGESEKQRVDLIV